MEKAIELFKTGMYVKDIANIVGINKWKLSVELKKLGFSPKSNASSKNNHPRWRGGRNINHDGYIRVLKRGHPRDSGNGYVLEHILVAEEKLGRPLIYFGMTDQRNETVHHINSIKTDNRPENLQILSPSQHSKLEWVENAHKYPQSKISQKTTPERYREWLAKNTSRMIKPDIL